MAPSTSYQAEPRRDDCKEAIGPLLLPPYTIWRACWLEYLVIIWHGRHLRAADIALSRVLCAPARSRRCLHSARHDSCLPSQRNAVIRASFWLLAHSVPLFTRSRASRFSASPDMSRARCSVQQQEEMFGGNGMRGERVRQHQAHCSWYVLALGRAGQLSLRYGCVLIASFLSWWEELTPGRAPPYHRRRGDVWPLFQRYRTDAPGAVGGENTDRSFERVCIRHTLVASINCSMQLVNKNYSLFSMPRKSVDFGSSPGW